MTGPCERSAAISYRNQSKPLVCLSSNAFEIPANENRLLPPQRAASLFVYVALGPNSDLIRI